MVVRNKYKSDFRNNEHYLSSGENEPRKKIQACSTGFEPTTSKIRLQCSTN